MLDHLGHPDAAAHLLGAIEDVLAQGPSEAPLTPDLQGTGTTAELGRAITERVAEHCDPASPPGAQAPLLEQSFDALERDGDESPAQRDRS